MKISDTVAQNSLGASGEIDRDRGIAVLALDEALARLTAHYPEQGRLLANLDLGARS